MKFTKANMQIVYFKDISVATDPDIGLQDLIGSSNGTIGGGVPIIGEDAFN